MDGLSGSEDDGRAVRTTEPLPKRGCLGRVAALAGVAVAVVYLLNFTWGVAPELPDNLPLIGNLDEAAAAALLFTCLRYLGVDILPFRR